MAVVVIGHDDDDDDDEMPPAMRYECCLYLYITLDPEIRTVTPHGDRYPHEQMRV